MEVRTNVHPVRYYILCYHCVIKIISCWNRKWLASATSVEQGQPAFPCCLIILYAVGWPTLNSHLDIPKNHNVQNWKMDYSMYEIQQDKVYKYPDTDLHKLKT